MLLSASGKELGRNIVLFIKCGQQMKGERMNIMGSQDTVNGRRISLHAGTADQFYKLIEHDEGVPFRLVFGKENGNGTFHFVGKGFEKMTGLSGFITEQKFCSMVEEINPISENIPSDPVKLHEKVLTGEISDYKIEIKIALPCGEKKWLRESSIPLRDDVSGNIAGVMGIFHDITEKKMFMAYLDEARERACECERLKTNFLQNISHEVRTPLNAIVGFSTLLCEQAETYHRKAEYISMITDSTDRFLEVMDNILEISRIEAGSTPVVLSDVKPAVIIRRVFENFNAAAEGRGINLKLCMSADAEPSIRSDERKLYQIINGLVSNAVKFTISGKVEFGFMVKESFLEFFVADSGIGIPEIHKPHIFNKFYQADTGSTRKFPGVGLGLTISKAYAELLGGKISFVSREGEGSTFRLIIPYGSASSTWGSKRS